MGDQLEWPDLEAARSEIEKLRLADQIVRDLMGDEKWRHPRNDIYSRMIDYVKTAKERLE